MFWFRINENDSILSNIEKLKIKIFEGRVWKYITDLQTTVQIRLEWSLG